MVRDAEFLQHVMTGGDSNTTGGLAFCMARNLHWDNPVDLIHQLSSRAKTEERITEDKAKENALKIDKIRRDSQATNMLFSAMLR